MRIANLGTGAAKLTEAMKDLEAAWGEATAQWNDQAMRNFEKDHLEEIGPSVGAALDAIKRLDEVLARGQRECE
jgi:hypothetical protein